ncbi:MAG: ADP-ribosylglycohydrolase family protein [Bacteroidota bacterium]
MLGALAGDIIGSIYERHPHKSTDFPLFGEDCRFTDDTVLTVAVAEAILREIPYEQTVRRYARAFPGAGYGGRFIGWMTGAITGPYNSWGNGSAMRVSPVGFAFDTKQVVLAEAKATADITHNHPEGVKGAQAVALAVLWARSGYGKAVIKDQLEANFGYDLSTPLADIRPTYQFDVSCAGSVPQSIVSFLESESWESAVRNAVSLGGDADTMASIAGAIAEAFYGGVPAEIEHEVMQRIPDNFKDIITAFYERFNWQEAF